MTTIGLTITALAGAGIFIVGVLYLSIPMKMAANFGIPQLPSTDAAPWLRLKGIRDTATGVAAATLLLTAPSDVVGWVVLAFTIIPLGDAATVHLAGGPRWATFGVHATTALLMLVAAALLLIA